MIAVGVGNNSIPVLVRPLLSRDSALGRGAAVVGNAGREVGDGLAVDSDIVVIIVADENAAGIPACMASAFFGSSDTRSASLAQVVEKLNGVALISSAVETADEIYSHPGQCLRHIEIGAILPPR